ncbi:MAG: phosphosulfolactate synthase [Cyanobacteria bacterium]|nr:phosphosulfolactate synthase [Cyanobacteriota bacterium]
MRYMMPNFLELPERSIKPRTVGLTHVIDRGLGLHGIQDFLDTALPSIDIVKLGWGTSYVTANLKEKIKAYQDAGLPVYLGGSLFEIALSQGKVSQYCDWLKSLNINMLEVSNGMIGLLAGEKKEWIRKLSRDFIVVSEVGSKDPNVLYPPENWALWVEWELEAGAQYVIAEGRESGTAGIYDTQGNLREDIISAMLDRVPHEKIIFEVPQRRIQTWFIENLGANVNLGNIPPADVIGLETLRLGLRSDTFHLIKDIAKTPL